MNTKNLESLNFLFYPRNVAIFGASEKLWYMVKGFEEHNFNKNKLYLINPSKGEIFGQKCYKSIDDIPDETIDLLILAVGRDRLAQSLKELIEQKDIKTIHIFTAGTGESDEKGVIVENELFNIFNNENLSTRAIGPNCMGVYSVKGHLAYEPFLPTEPGNISLVFQSGDLHSQTIRIGARRHNLKYSKGVSIGNCIDLQISDFLQYYNNDDDTDLIMVYFEGINAHYPNEGKELLKTLRAMKKPVLFMHGGKTSRAQKAALTHTGSISTNQKIWKAIYKQTPIVEVPTSLDDMIDYAFIFYKVINRYRDSKNDNYRINYPKGKNVLLILWSGGFGIIDTNMLTELGMNIPYFEGEILEKLRKIYPIKIGSLSNPLDIPWVSSSETYFKIAKVASSENVDLVIIETDMWEEEPHFDRYYNNILAIRKHVESLDKIFILILPEYPARHRQKYYKKLIDDDFIVYPSVRRAAKAFLALYDYGKKIENLNKK